MASPSSRVVADPIETRRDLPGDSDDSQSRYIEAAIDGILIACLYLPNGNPAPGSKFDYKLRWFQRLTDYAAELIALDEPVILAGDYNVMPTELDVYKPERWVDDALVPAGSAESVPGTCGSGLDRRTARPASWRAHLYLLGLFQKRLGP